MSEKLWQELIRGPLLWALGPLLAAAIVGGAVWFMVGPASLHDEPANRAPEPTPKTEGISIALVPERNVFEQRRRYEPLCQYLSKRIGVPTHIKSYPDYSLVLSEIVGGRVDAAFLGSFTYALAYSKAQVQVIARPLSEDGTSTYCGYLFVRADSGIHDAAGMKGKVLALVSRDTTAGYLFPLTYVRQHDVTDIEQYFSRVYYTGTHDAAAMAVFRHEADVGAAKNHQFDELAATVPGFAREMEVLARSPEVPSNGLVVRKDVPAALAQALRKALLEMHEDPEGALALKKLGAAKFIPTSHKDYENLYRMLDELQIDPSTY